MPEPLIMTVIAGVSSVVGVSAKGWELYRQVKNDTVRSQKKLLVQLAATQRTGMFSGKNPEKALQEVYDALAEAKPFVSDLYKRQLAAYAISASSVTFLAVGVVLFLLWISSHWIRLRGNPLSVHDTLSSYGWMLCLLAFLLAWLFSSKAIPTVRAVRWQKSDLASIESLISGMDVLRNWSTQLIRDTQERFYEERRLLSRIALSDFEWAFLNAYLELSCMVRSLELQALYLEFRNSSEAVHDYLRNHILAQIDAMIIAMVERKTLTPKPSQPNETARWQTEQKQGLSSEFATNGMGKYLKAVEASFWNEDFVQLSKESKETRVSRVKSWFPSFAEK